MMSKFDEGPLCRIQTRLPPPSLHVCQGLLSYKYANVILRLAKHCNNIYIEIGVCLPLNSYYYSTVQTNPSKFDWRL